MKNSEKSQTSSYICAKYTSSSAPSETSTTTSSSVPGIAEINIIDDMNGLPDYKKQILIKRADYYLSKIPFKVKKQFLKDGWELILTTDNLAEVYHPEYDKVFGITDYSIKTIYIQAEPIAIPYLLHEFGHYIDYTNGFPSKSSEFYSIYQNEICLFRESILQTAIVNDPTEFFSYTFHYSIVNPSACSLNALEYVNKFAH